jgi:hypothetical protein
MELKMKRVLDKTFVGTTKTACSRLLIGLSAAVLFTITGTGLLAQEQLYPPDDAPFERLLEAPLIAPGPADYTATEPDPVAPADLTATAGTWTAQGPGPSRYGQVENLDPDNEVSGAVHALAAHPTNADILYLGGVNGGIWKTVNAMAISPTWSPLTDDADSLSIGALEFDTSDVTDQTLWAGIGRFSSYGSRGGHRTGLLKTIDGGANWTVVDGGGALQGLNISGIAPRGNTIVVSVNIADSFTFGNIGIFRSADGGAGFTQISSGNGAATGLPGGLSFDLGSNRNAPTILYTSMIYADAAGGTNGIYKSSDTGATWTKVSSAAMDALLISGTTSNVEISVGNSGAVNVAILNSGQLRNGGVFRSVNGNVGSWVAMDVPLTNEGGTSVGTNPTYKPDAGIPGGQGAVHFSILADLTSPMVLYVGGDRQPVGVDAGGNPVWPNAVGAYNYTGRLFRGDASVTPTGGAPSPQWDHLTHSDAIAAMPGGGTASSSAPHADSREMVFDANGDIIEGDDAGINVRTSPQDNTGDWFSINGNLQVTEQHDIAYDSISNFIVSGNQDTGTTQQSAPGSTTWNTVGSGDGGDVAVSVDPSDPAQSIRYSSSQNLGGLAKRTYDASGGQVGFTAYPAKLVISGALFGPNFVTPIEVNEVDANRLLFGGNNGLYESADQGATMSQLTTADVNSSDGGNMMVYGGRSGCADNPDLIYAAVGSDIVIRTTAAGTVASVGGYTVAGGGSVRGVIADPEEWNTVFAIDADDHVFMSTNAGANWTDITGDLATAYSPLDLRSTEFIRVGTRGAVLVGTSRGVYVARDTDYTTWERVGGGLPNAPVWDMDYDASDDVLIAGTLGRGTWKMTQAAETVIPLDDSLDYGDAPATYCDASHLIGGPVLGVVSPDGEWDTQSTANADGDDTGTADEDGVTFQISGGDGTYSIDAQVTGTNATGSPAMLCGYLDGAADGSVSGVFDRNVTYTTVGVGVATAGAGNEEVCVQVAAAGGGGNAINYPAATGFNGASASCDATGGDGSFTCTLSFNPKFPTSGTTYARFRLTTDPAFFSTASPASIGAAQDGEVEDYWLDIEPTAIDLVSFSATAKDGYVQLAWETASEVDTAGFHLWRSSPGDPEYVQITASLIPSKGGPSQGAEYIYKDHDIASGGTYYYVLEDIDYHGTSTFHEPVSVRVPEAIILRSPADNAHVPPQPRVAFQWESEFHGQFKLQFSKNPGFKSRILTLPRRSKANRWITATTYTPGKKEWRKVLRMGRKGKPIYWRVYGSDGQGGDFTSKPQSFVIGRP